jgi:hypothetical protein
MSGFTSLRTSNRKTSCQTNLTQIYQAIRLYAQDNEYPPFYNPGSANSSQPSNGLGLWALYTYPDPANQNLPAPIDKTGATQIPMGVYLRNVSAFHCPSDNSDWDHDGISSNQAYSVDNATTRVLNPEYLSYQTVDQTSDPLNPTYNTYSLYRASTTHRQLEYWDSGNSANLGLRPAPGTTVVTWCRFHRNLDVNGATKSGRNYDNVLFYDGSIQWLPEIQDVTDSSNSSTGQCSGWKRVPREFVNNMADPTNCKPTSTD